MFLSCLHGPETLALQGAQAHAAGVLFPSDDEVLQRTILIANINPLINTEQVGCDASTPAVSTLCHVARATGVSSLLVCLGTGETAVRFLWSSQELPHGGQQPICVCRIRFPRGE